MVVGARESAGRLKKRTPRHTARELGLSQRQATVISVFAAPKVQFTRNFTTLKVQFQCLRLGSLAESMLPSPLL